MKDRFSSGSQLYQLARPSYPASLIQEILKHVATPQFAWDCGAGSGQLTQLLAPHFDAVVATDISAHQLQHAPYFENVSYQVQSAEHTSFAEQSFDLITVAQAIHWFDFEKFYAEVKRTLKPDGIFAVIGYGLLQLDDIELNQKVIQLYTGTLNGFWDAERSYIDEHYQSIPFPFDEIIISSFQIELAWTGQQLWDYLNIWSAIKHYQKQLNLNPLDRLKQIILSQHTINVSFPILLRVGRLPTLK